ncbi:MAG: hypothetical protein SVX38_02445 [Chloroflexota bacterium]|nr:hypothetical protein [Chloroflexota bacterium]
MTKKQLGILAFLAVANVLVLGSLGVLALGDDQQSAEELMATLVAMPTATSTPSPSPTPIPTLPPVNADCLVCQREAGAAMYARRIIGAVHVTSDGRFEVTWLCRNQPINTLDDALDGIMQSFLVALQTRDEQRCPFDQVWIQVWDERAEQRTFRLSVRASVDDLRAWRSGLIDDPQLIERLEVDYPPPQPTAR